MKKSHLLLFVAAQYFYSYAAYSETKRSFTNLDAKQPKLTSNKRVAPSERLYLGSKSSKKYILRNSESEEIETINKTGTNASDPENSIYEEENGTVVSGPLEESSDELSETESKRKATNDSNINPQPNNGGYYKIGNPYQIGGVTYYPEKYDNFEEVGLASWYGSEFDGKVTANGEIYHMQDFTAAHRTLPLPSMVKITNLNNGKTVTVRVNDRGPFASNRVIDVSERAAEHLGFKNKGTTTVKIQFLKNETRALLVKINREKNEQLQK